MLLTVGKNEQLVLCMKNYDVSPAHFVIQEFSPSFESKNTFYKVFTEIYIVKAPLFLDRQQGGNVP